MRDFFLLTVIYCGVALGFALYAGQDAEVIMGVAIGRILAAAPGLIPIMGVILAISAMVRFAFGRKLLDTFCQAASAALSVTLLMAGFLTFKTAMPDIHPYFADAWLADLDAMLHFGVDPWRITHGVAGWLPSHIVDLLYVKVWAILVLALPVAMAFDPVRDRQKRFVLLYLSAWIVCGSLLALGGLSAGPVFADAVMGGDRFADLHAALASSGIADGLIGKIQAFLWEVQEAGTPSLASGISAFPSVHVSVAVVAALYLQERVPPLALVGWAFAGVILFLSVYTGYHYALDGYAAIATIVAIWTVLRRPRTLRMPQTAQA